MRGDYKYWRGALRPEIFWTLSDFTSSVGSPVTFDGVWIDGAPDGTDFGGNIFSGGPGGFYVSFLDLPHGVSLGTALLPYGTNTNVVLSPILGNATGYIDEITFNLGDAATSFKCTKGVGGPKRSVCTRVFVNFNGCHDNWIVENDPSAFIYFFDLFFDFKAPGSAKRLYGRALRKAGPVYQLQFFNDLARTVLLYQSKNDLNYGDFYNEIEIEDVPATTIEGAASCLINDTGFDYDFEVFISRWNTDEQNPSPINYVDISPYLKGQFRITGSEYEGILNKDVSRKVNMTLENKDNIFDYRVFQIVFDPLATPPELNGPYDPHIYSLTGGATGGKKIGNIRSGRFVVVQVGVYDHVSSTWNYLDKFRGRVGDIQYSVVDETVQLSLDDERNLFKQIESASDLYVNKTFEEIFADQCELRLGIYNTEILAPVTNFTFPFVFIPDAGKTVWTALVKLSEVIGGKIDLLETGKIICHARLFEGDDAYVFDAGNHQDEVRTFGDNVVDNVRDILSSSTLFNQKIINRVTITSKPTTIEEKQDKIWKFKAFYDEDAGKNTGWLKPDRYFGDVWAQNLLSDSGAGPVKSIDRDGVFDTSSTGIHNESFILNVDAVPGGGGAGTCDITITRQYDGNSWNGTVACDGVTEFHVGAISPVLANVYVIMEPEADLTVGDQSELQIGISYYADLGSKFRVLPNDPTGIPGNSPLQFTLVSSIADPGGPLDWTEEKQADSSTNGNGAAAGFADRVVMALDPEVAVPTNWDTDNIFYNNSKDGDALTRIPILIVNRDTLGPNNRYVNSLEIFGRRIVEQSNMVVNTKAPSSIIHSFGGEQLLEIGNDFIANNSHAELLGKFIVDNYEVCRDIPEITLKQPRPFLQVGDRIRLRDTFTAIVKEFIIRNLDEVYSIDNVTMNIKLREADAGTGAYDVTGSNSETEIENRADYIKLNETVDTGRGGTSTELRRDIYMMRGFSYHGRRFNFVYGDYSTIPGPVPPPPPLPPAWLSESFAGEPREFAEPPTVLVFHVYNEYIPGGGAVQFQEVGAKQVTTTFFDIEDTMYGSVGGNVHGWVGWIAIGVSKSTL